MNDKKTFYRHLDLWFFLSIQIIYRFFLRLSFQQILTANINTYSEVENALQPIIMAQKVRIYPYSQYDRTVCLRAELIGCIWDGEFCFVFRFFFCVSLFWLWKHKKTFLASENFMLVPLHCIALICFVYVFFHVR